jgi:hypothetical protein
MPKKKALPASGAYQLLVHVPKIAIIQWFLDRVADKTALHQAYQSVTGRAIKPTKQSLVDLSVPELVRVFERCGATSADDARVLHDSWRYRGMKAFFLYRLSGKCAASPDSFLADLNAAHSREPAPRNPDLPSFDDQFQFTAVDELRFKTGSALEIRYRYAAPIEYIDPADEDAKIVADLRSGFAWVFPMRGWAAVNARDLQSRDRIAACLQSAMGCRLSGLCFTKDIISGLEVEAKRRRAACIDPQTGTTRRYSGKRLGSDKEALGEIRQRSNRDEVPFSSFDVPIDDDKEMVLGYNNNQGKVFFSKDLTVDQLRTWGPQKIDAVVQMVHKTLESKPRFKVALMSAHLKGLAAGARAAAIELANAVAECKTKGITEVLLATRAQTLRESLKGLVQTSLRVLDDKTEEVAALQCPTCQEEEIEIGDDGRHLRCASCGQELRGNIRPVVEGAAFRIGDLTNSVLLFPTAPLKEAVLSAAAAVTPRAIDIENEYFFVRGNTLYCTRLVGDAVLELDAIPEMAPLLNGPLSAQGRSVVLPVLADFKEKCRHISTANCQGCVDTRVGEKCFLRLFGLFDEDFVPTPHHGNEYGDYHAFVTIDKKPDQALVVVMKSMPSSAGEITAASSHGREILQQAIFSFRKTGVAAVGVSVPRRLHGDLRQSLIDQARFHTKKVVFIGEEQLGRIAVSAMKRRKAKLGDL